MSVHIWISSACRAAPDERRAVVAAAPLQVVYFAVEVAADVALRHQQPGILVGGQQPGQVLGDVGRVRLAVLVDAHVVQRGQQRAVLPRLLQIEVEHGGGKQLALRQDGLFLEHGEHRLGKRADVFEVRPHDALALAAARLGGIQLADGGQVLLFERVDFLQRAGRVALVEIVGYFHQAVGGAAHGREHHNLPLAVAHQLGNLLHAGGGAYGRAAEFQYFHRFYYEIVGQCFDWVAKITHLPLKSVPWRGKMHRKRVSGHRDGGWNSVRAEILPP